MHLWYIGARIKLWSCVINCWGTLTCLVQSQTLLGWSNFETFVLADCLCEWIVKEETNTLEKKNRSWTCISCRHMLWFQPFERQWGGRLPLLSSAPTGNSTFTGWEKIHSSKLNGLKKVTPEREHLCFSEHLFIINHRH